MLRAEGTSLRPGVSVADFILHGAFLHPGGKSYKTGVLKSRGIISKGNPHGLPSAVTVKIKYVRG